MRCFSMAQDAANSNPPTPPVLMKKPPNVNFDPKSKSSPFFGLKPLPKEVVLSSRTEEVEPDEDNDEDDYTEDVDDDQWFDVSERLKAMNVPAIPLPERLHVSVLDKNDGTIVGSIYLNPIVFGQGNIRVDILHRVVQYQRAKKRGKRKHLTKTISTRSGSGRKVRPQKGGGTARAGHSRPPHWRGGARAHGPKGVIQDYTQKLNKKIRKLGMVHALSQKLMERNLVVLNDFLMDSHKTKDLGNFLLEHFKVGGRAGTSAILCDHVEDETADAYRHLPLKLTVAAGNLSKIKVLHPQYLNVFDLLKYEKIIVTVGGIERLESIFKDAAY